MRYADRVGHCRAYSKADGSSYMFTVDQYAALLVAFLAGDAFFHGTGIFGDSLVIRLGAVEAVALCSAESCARGIADDEEDRRERAIRGDDA